MGSLLLLSAQLTTSFLVIVLSGVVKPVVGASSARPVDKLSRSRQVGGAFLSQGDSRILQRHGSTNKDRLLGSDHDSHSQYYYYKDRPAVKQLVRTPVVQDGPPDEHVLEEREGRVHTGEHTFWPPDQGNGLTAWIFAFFFVLLIASVPIVLHFCRVKATFSLVLMFEGLALITWLVFGLVCFTQLVMFQSSHFGDDIRTLTLVEAVYLFAQILTTVGYGDITPAYAGGQAIVACFVFIAIILIAELISELSTIVMERAHKHVEMALEQASQVASARLGSTDAQNNETAGSSKVIGQKNNSPRTLLVATMFFVIFVAIGTCFFHLYPGEGKTWGQGLYMSIITLTTVGFGAFTAETEAGKVFGSFWMVLGVLSLGGVVTAFTEYMIFLREKEHTHQFDAAADDVLHQECVDHQGRVDQLGYLRYALMKYHIAPKTEIDSILRQFQALDRDHRGTVSVELVKQLSVPGVQAGAGRRHSHHGHHHGLAHHSE